uniref:Uncharacterized protein n=1 Tax=Plectus sambesii TaxID=2011161 RepID=A0A914V2C8_9BILA
MRILYELFVLTAVFTFCDSAKRASTRPKEEEDDDDIDDRRWLDEACHQYNFCLQEADRMLAACNSLDKHSGEDDDDEHDEIHDCAHPTLVLKKDLRVKREHRKSSLRNCFETGHLE